MISFGDELAAAMRVPDATDMDEQSDRQNEVYLYFGFGDGGEESGLGLFGDRRRRGIAAFIKITGQVR